MDARLAAFLAERTRTASLIHITHQEIAAKLGSSREVISRILEDFSDQGLLRSTRGTIEVLDLQALQGRSVV
jgi:CRP/FNR family transcriptional regulator